MRRLRQGLETTMLTGGNQKVLLKGGASSDADSSIADKEQ